MTRLDAADELYLGTERVDRVYAGSALVWGSYSPTILADTPNGYWRLKETSGTVAYDSSGNNRNATYTGTWTLGGEGPLPGGKYASNGNKTGHLTLPTVPLRTVEFIVNRSSLYHTTGWNCLLDSRSAHPTGYVATLGTGPNWPSLYVNGVARGAPGNLTQIPFDEWVHVVLVAALVADARALIFSSTLNANERMAGQVSEVATYNYALTPEQISDHFAALGW